MDPDANLREQRELVRAITAIFDAANAVTGEYTPLQAITVRGYATRLAELVEALDRWITAGGLLPQPWQPRVPEASGESRKPR